MLETKLEFRGTDSTGRVITVKDITGVYDSVTNPTGYNNPNLNISDIENILFTISEYDSDTIKKLRFVRVVDPLHPEYLLQPSIDDIANGVENVEFNSIVLGITDTQEGLKAFSDGVYDINMYTLFDQMAGTANKGDKVITGSGFTTVYDTVDFIEINNIIYTIDKSIPADDNNLTLVEELEEDVNEFFQAYRSNIKGINSAASDCCGNQEAGKVSESDCSCNKNKFDALFKLWMYKIAATIDFNCDNYKRANDLLKASQKVCKSFNCKCG